MIEGGGIKVIVGEDGIQVLFIASNGHEVVLDALAVSGSLDPAGRRAMVQWCRDRLNDAVALDLPENVRRQVEARINQIAKPH